MTVIDTGALYARARNLYLRRPLLTATLLAIVGILLAYSPAFVGARLIPYDFQTDYYPWYVDSLRAFRVSPFEMFDPYKLGGVMTFPLLGFYDLIDAAPGFFHLIPNLVGYQALILAHLVLIPIGIAMMLAARGVPPQRAILLVPIALVASALGPDLKYAEWVKPVEAYAYSFLVLGALEMLRASLRVRWAAVLGLALGYSFIYFGESAVYWPLIVLPYFFVYRDCLLTRRGIASGALAAVIACIVALPCVLVTLKLFNTIQVSESIHLVNTLGPVEALGFAGIPVSAVSLVSVPFTLGALAALSFRVMSRAERIFFGLFVVLAAAYSFATLTPVGPIVRAVYPVARLSRRADVILYLLIPVMVLLAVRSVAVMTDVPARFAAVGVSVFAVLAAVAAIAHQAALLVIAGVALFVLPLAKLRSIGWWSAALVMQWLILCFVPYWTSSWSPQAVTSTDHYFAPFRSLESYLPYRTSDSAAAYRVLSVGLPATFGSYAPVFQYYNVGADYGVIFPRALVERSGITHLHAAEIGAEIEADPGKVGSLGLRSMAVRYYFFGPDVYAAVADSLRRESGLVPLNVPGYWRVVRDDRAQPFVVADFPDHAITPVDATMGRSWIRFTAPPGASDVRLAFTFDPWWHVRVGGTADDGRLSDIDGQLAVNASGAGLRTITLRYGDERVVISLALLLALYAGGVAAVAATVRRALVPALAARRAAKAAHRRAMASGES